MESVLAARNDVLSSAPGFLKAASTQVHYSCASVACDQSDRHFWRDHDTQTAVQELLDSSIQATALMVDSEAQATPLIADCASQSDWTLLKLNDVNELYHSFVLRADSATQTTESS